MPPELEEVRSWIEKADHDWQTAELVMEGAAPMPDVAAFHTQQAVEKYLKAFLVWKQFSFEKIHDLEELVGNCEQYEASFADLKSKVAPLSAYAVRFRYPVAKDPAEEEVRDALAVVDTVRRFVAERLPPETLP